MTSLLYQDPYAAAEAYLQREGVDVERAFAVLDHVREDEQVRARAAADSAGSLALALKKAERQLLYEARGFNDGAAGFTAAGLAEARERVTGLTAALEDTCLNDPVLISAARRSVA
jgi:hypothetical protein